MEFSCGNQNDFIVTTVEYCACQVCGEDLLVTFIGSVESTSGDPIILATVTVTVNGTDSTYLTNDFGLFGFTVSSSIEEVTISVTAMQYTGFSRTYTVVPGEQNTVSVLLQEVITTTFIPDNVAIIVSTATLEITKVDDNFTAVEETQVGETFVMLQADFFEENTTYTFESTNVNIAMDQDIESSDIPFTVQVASRRRRRDDGRVRRQSSTTEVLITAVAIGSFSILTNGVPINVNSDLCIVISTQFINSTYSESELRDSKLYVLSNGELFLGNGTPNVREETNNSFVVEFQYCSIVFPLRYVIAFLENETCFVAVRAFDDNGATMETEVQAVSRVDKRKVNKEYGNTRSCVRILCKGTLTLKLIDTLDYMPDNYTVDISGLIQRGNSPIYDNVNTCNNNNNTYNFTQVPSEPPPTSVISVTNVTGYCTVEIEVVICPGRMIRVFVAGVITDQLNSTEMVTDIIGSGITCVKEHPLCVLIPCNSQVNVSVEQYADTPGVDSQFCAPSRVVPNGPLINVMDMNMTAMFEVSSMPTPRAVALPICSVTLGRNAGIRFQCFF